MRSLRTKACCGWVLLLAFSATTHAQQKQPAGKGIDAATVAAYEKPKPRSTILGRRSSPGLMGKKASRVFASARYPKRNSRRWRFPSVWI